MTTKQVARKMKVDDLANLLADNLLADDEVRDVWGDLAVKPKCMHSTRVRHDRFQETEHGTYVCQDCGADWADR